MSVTAFDHVAVPTTQPLEMIRFYGDLGFSVPQPQEWLAKRLSNFAVQFGDNKIHFHSPWFWQDPNFTLRGPTALPGCGDICFVWSASLDELKATLQRAGAVIEVGPVERVGGRDGGRTKGTSIYTRDPDRNLLEFIVYD